MVNRCAVAGCHYSNEGTSFHRFPKDEKLRTLWVRFVKLTRSDFREPTKHSYVCSAHFADNCFHADAIKLMTSFGITARRKLLPNSVPSIYPRQDADKEDVLNEGFLSAPKKKRMSTAFRKREKRRILEELVYNVPSASGQASNTEPCDVQPPYLAEPCHQPQTPVLTTPYVCDKSNKLPEVQTKPSYVSILRPLDQIMCQSEREKKVIPIVDRKDSQCQTLSSKTRFKSQRIQVQPKYSDKGLQVNMEPRQRSIGIQCNVAETGIQKQTTDQKHTFDTREQDVVTEIGTQKLDDEIPDDQDDPSYEPSGSDLSGSGSSETSKSHNESPGTLQDRKFIVCEDQLLQLFKTCHFCSGPSNGTISQIMGTLIKVDMKCDMCAETYRWYNQTFAGSIPTVNLSLSCGILFAGALPTKVLRVLDFMNVATISTRTFFNHQRDLLYPSIIYLWKRHQTKYIERVLESGESLVLGGDGRADTPGHSAKYGSYSMMDLDRGVVLDIQLVQSNEVTSSNAMEKEGLIRSLKWIKDNELTVKTLITDQHCQIQKHLREKEPQITHYFDVWHVAKGLKKKMVALSKEKDCSDVNAWIKSITNHMYWSAASTSSGNGDIMVSKWMSVANHVQNIHSGHSDNFPKCTHGPIEEQTRAKKWLKPGTKACTKLEDLLTTTRLKSAVKKLSPLHQTSDVEAFHSTITHFAPKMTGFSFHGMNGRLLLAALHYNENSYRPQARTANGVERYSIHFPKYKKGEFITRELKINQTFRYVNILLKCVEKMTETMDNGQCVNNIVPTPKSLCADFDHPVKTDAVAAMKSRFLR